MHSPALTSSKFSAESNVCEYASLFGLLYLGNGWIVCDHDLLNKWTGQLDPFQNGVETDSQ